MRTGAACYVPQGRPRAGRNRKGSRTNADHPAHGRNPVGWNAGTEAREAIGDAVLVKPFPGEKLPEFREGAMGILLIIAVYAGAILISTAVFGASLFLVEDIKESSFRTDGQVATWGKCAAIVVVMTVLGLLPFGGLLALIAFFVGVMALFQKTFLQALLLLIVNGVFSLGIGWVIGKVLAGLVSSD